MHVILLKSGSEPPVAALNALRRGGIKAKVCAGIDDEAFARAAERPFAIVCELAEEIEANGVRAIIERIAAAFPEAALVAYRRADDSQREEERPNSNALSERTLKFLGFHAVASEPSQLPELLRILERHSQMDAPADSARKSLHGHTSAAAERLRDQKSSVGEMMPSSLLLPERMGRREIRAAFELAASLHFAFDQKSAAHAALAGLAPLVNADRWTIYIKHDETDGALEPLAARGLTASERDAKTRDWRNALRGELFSLAGAISKAALAAAAKGEAARTKEGGRRALAVPLIASQAGEDRIFGVLEVVRESVPAKDELSPSKIESSAMKARTKAFTKPETALLVALSAPLAAALINAARIAEAERLSLTDDLTKLHNARFLRQYLVNEIKRARRYKSSVAALFLDLDDFKKVNDRHGHLVGSHILTEMALVILACVRDTDVVARYGGDEFVVILPETDTMQAARVAERVRARIAAHTFNGGRGLSLRLTASFGVAAFPEHVQSPQQLLARADAAMYEAKDARKNCVRAADAPAFAD